VINSVALSIAPGAAAVAGSRVAAGSTASQDHIFLVVAGEDGRAEVVRVNDQGVLEQTVWPQTVPVHSSPAPDTGISDSSGPGKDEPALPTQTTGVAFNSGQRFALTSPAGVTLQGWPRQPQPLVEVATPAQTPSPLRSGHEIVYQSRDGRAFCYDNQGSMQPGWPVAGPSAAAGTGLFLDLDADGNREFVACGTALRIDTIDTEAAELVTVPLASLVIWSPVGRPDTTPAERLRGWTMWRGTPWRNPGQAESSLATSGGNLLVAGSHFCYPNPLTTDNLRVRAEARQPGEAQVVILNLEGEEVVAAGPTAVTGGEPFEIELPFANFASGVYLCRLEFRCECGGSETSIVTFAAAR
jgi:hypothetical protein